MPVIRTTLVRNWIWRIKEVILGFLKMISKIMVRPILRTEREVYREENNDFYISTECGKILKYKKSATRTQTHLINRVQRNCVISFQKIGN